MVRMLIVFTIIFILSSTSSSAQTQILPTDIHTIDTMGTTEIPNYKNSETYKATVIVNERYKSQDDISHLKFLLVDSQDNKIVEKSFDTMGNKFSIDIIDLDGDGEKDFVFFVREQILSHIHKTLVIHRKLRRTHLKEILSIPYAGKTNGGTDWTYKHSYFRQDEGNIHIKLTLDIDTPDKTTSHFPAKTRWINIADQGAPTDIKKSEPPNPMQMYFRKEEYFIPNLLGDKGYTIRVNPKRGAYLSGRDILRSIQVVDKDGNIVAERPFRAYYGGYRLALFDIDADDDKEFIFILHTGSGTGYMAFEMSIDKIVGGQFIPIVTFPIAVAGNQGEWFFSDWKYKGYDQTDPTDVVFSMTLHYTVSSLYEKDGLPDNFPREENIVFQFKKDKYIISTIYPSKTAERPRNNWVLDDNWIFK